jgi:hypothetical protein
VLGGALTLGISLLRAVWWGSSCPMVVTRPQGRTVPVGDFSNAAIPG